MQPQQPTPPPMRSLPRNATAMPFGMSANSLGMDDASALRLRRLLFIGIPVTVLLVLVLVTWLFVRNLTALSPQALTNSAFEYDFLFYKKSETVNLVAGSGLKYDNKALVIAKPTSDDVAKECANMTDGAWREVFRVSVEGVERPVCRLNDTVFALTVFHGKTKHLFEVTYNSPHDVNTNDLRRIMESLKISLP